MNKRIARLLGVFAGIFALCIALAACGGGSSSGGDSGKDDSADPAEDFVGYYQIVSIDADGESYDEDDLEELRDLGFNVLLELNKRGKATMNMMGEEMEGTWEATDEGEGTIEMDGDELDMILDGDELTITDGDQEMVFEKIDKSDYRDAEEAMEAALAGLAGGSGGFDDIDIIDDGGSGSGGSGSSASITTEDAHGNITIAALAELNGPDVADVLTSCGYSWSDRNTMWLRQSDMAACAVMDEDDNFLSESAMASQSAALAGTSNVYYNSVGGYSSVPDAINGNAGCTVLSIIGDDESGAAVVESPNGTRALLTVNANSDGTYDIVVWFEDAIASGEFNDAQGGDYGTSIAEVWYNVTGESI